MVHCHHEGSFNLQVHLTNEAGEDGLLRGGGDVGGHEVKMRVLKISASEGIKRGTNVEKRVDRKSERGGAEVVRKFFNVLGVWEVVAEGVGVKGNGYRVNRSKNCSQRDRRKSIRRGRGGTPPSLGSSRRRPRSIIDDRRSERRRGRRGGCIVRHGGGCSGRKVRSERRRGEVSYTK